MLGLRCVEANRIDLPLGWKNGQVQRPLPVLTILSRRVVLERPQEDLVSIFIRLWMVEDRGRHMGHRLKDDRLAVGAEVALPGPGEAEGDLPDIREMTGLEPRDLLGGKRGSRALAGRRVLGAEDRCQASSADENPIELLRGSIEPIVRRAGTGLVPHVDLSSQRQAPCLV